MEPAPAGRNQVGFTARTRLATAAGRRPATLLVAPLIGLLVLGIKRIDPGPAFYAQTRAGRIGKPIRVLKLRGMDVDAEQRLTAHSAADPRAGSEWDGVYIENWSIWLDLYILLATVPAVISGSGAR